MKEEISRADKPGYIYMYKGIDCFIVLILILIFKNYIHKISNGFVLIET